jgi:hypothetical protein
MAMVVSPHHPVGAAEEIRRFGPTRGVVAIWLPVLNILMGKPYYYPIYQAAEEQDLAILRPPSTAARSSCSTPAWASPIARAAVRAARKPCSHLLGH